MKNLTQRQGEVLKFIESFLSDHAYPPTIREIADNFAISVKGAYDHVAALKRKGHIRGDKRSRTIEVLIPSEKNPKDGMVVPILGENLIAGKSVLAEENWAGSITVHKSMLKGRRGSYFAIRVKGNSMAEAGLLEGDLVLAQKADSADNGQLVAAMMDDGLSLRRYFKEKNRVKLQGLGDKSKSAYTQEGRVIGRITHLIREY